MKKEALTINDLTAKRRVLWEKHHDIKLDGELVRAIADKILDTDSIRDEVINKPELLIEACFTITDKKRRSVPFFLNEVQKDFLSRISTLGRQKPYFVLKGRQQGFTTLITGMMLANAIVKRNFSGFTVADRDDNTRSIFTDKAKLMYSLLPSRLKPTEKFNSVGELYFDKLNSSWRIASATSNVGRSRTLSFIHYSEVAFFKCPLSDLQKSIAEAATEDALCIYETTANGFNDAKRLWDSGTCINLFYEWWKTSEYASKDHEYLKNPDTWLKNRLLSLKKRGLNDDQLAWYAKKYHSYIDKSAIRQEYPCSPEEAFVTSGGSVFDTEKISNYLSRGTFNSRRGYFSYKLRPETMYSPSGEIYSYKNTISEISFVESEGGYISIVTEPRATIEGGSILANPYVIGADTAGTGEDYFSAKVIDNTSGACVATLHVKNMDEDLFAHQLYCLGRYYHDALIAVEINYSRHPVRVLRELEYKNLYSSRTFSSSERGGEYGFLTTSVTRPIIISNLISIMRENIELETDRQTLMEMTTFVRREDGKIAAANGSHDDLVMASAIAHFVSSSFAHSPVLVGQRKEFISMHFSPPTLQNEAYMEW